MAQKKYLEEYLEVRKIEDSLKERKRLSKLNFIAVSIAAYTLILSLLLMNSSGVSRLFHFNDNDVDGKISLLENKVNSLQKQNDSLQLVINNQEPNNFQYYNLNVKLSKLQDSQNQLSSAMLMNPDEIVTARLITEKQKLLDEQLTSLKESFVNLSDTFNKLLWAMFILPLIGLGWSYIKEKFFKKQQDQF